jgi:hypothetical protein
MPVRAAATAVFALVLSTAPLTAEEIGCEGVFNQNATLADIEAAFGKGNVVTGEVQGPEGMTMIATTIFPDDPARKMEVRWWDEEKVEFFAGVTLAQGDTGPHGVKVGMPIGELQAINGEPFGLMGFFWDYGGGAGFDSGVLSDIAGGCYLNVRLSPTRENLPDALAFAISGDIELRSDLPELAEAEVAVWEVNLTYPYPEQLEGELVE